MEHESLILAMTVKIAFTLAVGKLCQIVLRGLKAHEIGDLAWLLSVVMCFTTGIELAKQVVDSVTGFIQPIITFVSWFTKDPDGLKRSWWDWLNTYPKGGP